MEDILKELIASNTLLIITPDYEKNTLTVVTVGYFKRQQEVYHLDLPPEQLAALIKEQIECS